MLSFQLKFSRYTKRLESLIHIQNTEQIFQVDLDIGFSWQSIQSSYYNKYIQISKENMSKG